MAERRMFAKTIIDSDAFLDMPQTSQLLYFHLCMRADDDGFVNSPKRIMRMVGCSDDDLKILFAKNFIIPFESGVVVIKHWKIHNYIRKDRYHETSYQEELNLLDMKDNNAYTLKSEPSDSNACELRLTSGLPLVDVGKDRLGKDRLDKSNSIKDTVRPSDEGQSTADDIKSVIDAWNELPITRIHAINRGTKRYSMLKARITEYGLDAVLEAINLISQSPFLLGKKTDFVITFDWFVRPNNFIKVYEGNYNEQFINKGKRDALNDFLKGGSDESTGVW